MASVGKVGKVGTLGKIGKVGEVLATKGRTVGHAVDERVLLPGVDEGVVCGGLPYEVEVDRFGQRAAVRRAAYDERLASRIPT